MTYTINIPAIELQKTHFQGVYMITKGGKQVGQLTLREGDNYEILDARVPGNYKLVAAASNSLDTIRAKVAEVFS